MANQDTIGITNLLFGIQQLGKAIVKTKRFRQLTPSAIWKQIMRPVLNQNEIQALEQNQDAQIVKQEILAIPNVLTKETIKDRMRRWMLKGFDLIPVGKDDDGQCWPGFGPGVEHATDWRKSKQQGQTPSMDDVRAFYREHNFDLRIACVRKEYDSEDDSETLQSAKTIKQEFGNGFGRHRDRSLSSRSKILRYDFFDRRSESRERSGSKGYSRPREYQGPRETRMDIDRNHNRFVTRNESRGRGRGTYRGKDYSYQGRGQNYQYRDQLNQERYREAQKFNPYTKQAFNKTKNPINWNRTHQYENRIEKKAGMTIQLMTGQNAHRCRKSQRTIAIETQPGPKMTSRNTKQQHHYPNNLFNKLIEYNKY
ncbi:MAG: hypothetical protein EZS28_046097, partial [Streblomastix strix]